MRTHKTSEEMRAEAKKEVYTGLAPKPGPTYSSVSETKVEPYTPEPKPRLRREIVKR